MHGGDTVRDAEAVGSCRLCLVSVLRRSGCVALSRAAVASS